MDRWTIVFEQGATYTQVITIDGVADIASATDWELVCADSDGVVYVTASITNGRITGSDPASKTVTIPASVTSGMPLGNGRFDFNVKFAGGVVRRYYSLGLAQVNPAAGA